MNYGSRLPVNALLYQKVLQSLYIVQYIVSSQVNQEYATVSLVEVSLSFLSPSIYNK